MKIFDPIYGIRVNGGIPADPSGLSATAISAVQVNVAWTDNSSNEDGFKVRRATSSGGPYTDLSPSPGAGVTSFSDGTTWEAIQYWYTVAAYRNTTGESGAPKVGPVLTPPRTPTNPSATPIGSNSVLVSWVDNSTAETGFPVERSSTSSGGPFTNVGTAPPRTGIGSTSFVNSTGVLDGTQYWYRVAAAKTGFPNSPYAGPVTATTPIKVPTSMVGAALAGRDNRLTWTDNSATEQGYKVERATKSGSTCGTYAEIATTAASSGTGLTVTYHDIGSGINPPNTNTTYCYRTRAYNPTGYSAYSAVVSIKTKL